MAVVRYVARNPVAAGLIADPVHWEWGSYRALVEGLPNSGFVDEAEVLGLFHLHRWRSRRAFRNFVLDGLVVPSPSEPGPLFASDAARRPSVWQLFCLLPSIEATQVCHEMGYTHAEIAAGRG